MLYQTGLSIVILMLCPQTVTVGSGQTVSFRTQQGEIYGKNTKCKVNFKVSLLIQNFC